MSGWVTKVMFTGAMRPTVDPDLPEEAARRIVFWPYRREAGQPVVLDWQTVKDYVEANGSATVWCPLNVPDNPDLMPETALTKYYAGSIPPIPEHVDPPVVVDPQFQTDLQAAATVFLGLLNDPRWEAFAARFGQLTLEDIELRPAFQVAAEIRHRLGMLRHGA